MYNYKDYLELKDNYHKDFNNIPMFGTFDIDEFYKKRDEFIEKYHDEQIVEIGDSSVFTNLTFYKQMNELTKNYRKNALAMLENNDLLLRKAFKSAMNNYEYYIAFDMEYTENEICQSVLFKNYDELTEFEKTVFIEAKGEYFEAMEKAGF